MTTKTDELRTLFLKLSPVTTFTDHQETTHVVGDVPSDRHIDESLGRLVVEMRDQFDFTTTLADSALVALLRGYYAGATDEALAEELGVSVSNVVDARFDLQLFRPTDAKTQFDLRTLSALVAAGEDDAACAATLDTDESTVRTARRLLTARRVARRDTYRYPLEFESLLGVDADETLSASMAANRSLFAEIKD